jgi:membrane protein implicated in regulation of membrane protease activity
MDAWVIWVVAAVVLLIAEATTSAFIAIYFGFAAIATAAVALTGVGVVVQLIAFVGLSVGSLILTRPALKRTIGSPQLHRMGIDAMQGKIGVVTRAIGELESGLVKVGGETWTARSFYDEEPIAEGSRVEVIKIEGVTALVVPAPSPHDDPTPELEE